MVIIEFWTIIKSAIPFILGLLVGAGITKNKNVTYIIIAYIVFIIIFNLLKDKIMKIRKSEKTKDALKDEAKEMLYDVGEATLKGNEKGAGMFDKYYPDYIFYVNLTTFIVLIFLLFKQQWLWALVCFFSLQFHMILNQVIRIVREIKDGNNR